MKRTILICSLLAGIFLAAADAGFAQGVADLRLFEQHCTSCHGNPSGPAGAPDGLALRRMTAEAVLAAITGPMHPALPGITDDEKRMIAGYLGGRKADVAKVDDAKLMPNQCPSNPPINHYLARGPCGTDGEPIVSNTRFQPAKMAGISADQTPNLKLKWAFGFPGSGDHLGPAHDCGGTSFYRGRYGGGLFDGRGDGMRALVVSGGCGSAQCDYGGSSKGPAGVEVRDLFRRRQGERLWRGCRHAANSCGR